MSDLHDVPHVHVRAPGKINVYMNVGQRTDDGYHDVATAYQAVSLFEDVRAFPSDGFSVAFSGPIDTRELPVDRTNLAIKAARMLAKKAGYDGGVHLQIEKHVPIAGGMGGGSADAAAALLACDSLWQTDVGRDELLRLAARLGADVPFSLVGGTAIGTGRGDRLSPALAKGTFHWVLALSDTGMSTPEVYGELDDHRAKHAADIAPIDDTPTVDTGVLQAIRAGDAHLLADVLHNDLQVAALHIRPELTRTLEVGDSSGALAGIVSGSGPTIALLAASAEAAIDVQVSLSASGIVAKHVTGPVAGARVMEV
ncbi:4-(cytidine 5'-diphospho)-2-C-methyl-D-erythritol kinase [Paramicrobacterium chengjingii]|uniref:4-diphosphocytidyl-2-C-methyl-D-erythritol kinase n=1 Tax=Paramicrobacterium chengjingii TaxID=2769067 RepID=A0ABX6YLD0_9MICO|nr:4-(cytidine 5'-diphospho)-2-C-methyl-D-erythritol kinase [Microbacterium chengjingii]QPZ39475.1 4-(cytidine 5'-diphospho)-2-C-methyl-D-erythritol kinase [Microbacterium chengjingii]